MKSSITQYGMIVLAAFLVNQVALPNFAVVKDQFEKRDNLLGNLAQAQEIQQKRDGILSYYNEISGNIQQSIQNAIPIYSDQNVAQFLIDFEELRRRSGLPGNTSISIGKVESSVLQGSVSLPITIQVSTSYTNLNFFIGNLQRWSRGIRISGVSISSAGESEEASNLLDVAVEFEALFTRNET